MNQYFKNLIKSFDPDNNYFWIVLISAAVLISMLPVAIFGVPSGNDVHQHFQFAQIFYDSLVSGNIFPSWSAFENYGFGGIGTRFYPPLGYYALAFARIITGNWYDATWITFMFWVFVGSFGTYLWAKEFLPIRESGVAAILFALAPFNLVQIYQYFVYAEFVASALLPFCFLFVTRVCKRGKPADIFGLGIAYALLILSHIPLTLIGSISLAVYALAILDRRKIVKSFIGLSCGVLLGLLACSFHWIRIVMEMQWLNHTSPRFTVDLYNYTQYFFPFYIDFSKDFWASYAWIMDITTILAALSVTIPAIALVMRSKVVSSSLKTFKGGIITGLFALFMTTSLSTVVWQIFPVLQKIQFPWRWFSVVFAIGVISFAGLVVPFVRANLSNRVVIYLTVIFSFGLIFFNYVQLIIPSAPSDREHFEEKLSNLLNEESFDCWWTVWSKREAFDNKELVSAEGREVKITSWNREDREFEVKEGKAENIRIATFYYPFWNAEVNGNKIATQIADDGTILIPISGEKSNVKLYFQSPGYIKATAIISIITWIFLCGGLCLNFLRRKP